MRQQLCCIVAVSKERFLKDFGIHVRALRIAANMTQMDLASRMNKDRQSIQRLESGNINPTIFYLNELAEGLEIDLKTVVNFVPKQQRKR